MTATASAAPRLFDALEARLDALDRLPPELRLWASILSDGRLEPRLAGLEAFARALAEGRVPATGAATTTGALPAEAGVPATVLHAWPDAALAARIAATLDALGLPAFCRAQPDLVLAVLRSLLFHLDLVVDLMDRGATRVAAQETLLALFADEWRERSGEIDELARMFGDLGDLGKTQRWDLLRGLLRSAGWQEAVRLRRVIEALPELAKVIRGLGRRREALEDDPALPREAPVVEPVVVPRRVTKRTRMPDVPAETRGLVRSGRVARMLPAESVLLLHPKLRMVWHARHAERTLLTYEDDDRVDVPVTTPQPGTRPTARRAPAPRLEAGPMLVCVDTSGSMQGGAEAVAKAVVLEAARTAHAQGRPCLAFAFGGPGEIVALELSVDLDGLERLARFMGQAFHGGTDIGAPIEAALARVLEARWRDADLLIASDGEFGATPATVAALAQAKATLGLRVQGVLIGDRETIGFLEVADAIHWVADWRRFGARAAPVPVHSRSLTALYFPGALRGDAAQATVDGAAASRALRGEGERDA